MVLITTVFTVLIGSMFIASSVLAFSQMRREEDQHGPGDLWN